MKLQVTSTSTSIMYYVLCIIACLYLLLFFFFIRVLYPGRSALHHFHMQNHTLQKEQVCKNHDQMKL